MVAVTPHRPQLHGRCPGMSANRPRGRLRPGEAECHRPEPTTRGHDPGERHLAVAMDRTLGL